MIRTLRHTVCALVLLAFAACSKEEIPRITITPEHILLSCDDGSEAVFNVTADAPWTLTFAGEGFTVTPGNGARGETAVTVTATGANTTYNRMKLGVITVRFSADQRDFPVEVSQKPAIASKTVLLYMPGRELLRFYKNNIEGIRKAVTNQIPGDGRMLVCYQPESNNKAILQEIYYNASTNQCETKELKIYEPFDTGSAGDVQQMFADAAEFSPARNYGLIIGCHGKAWIPASSGTIPYSVRSGKADDVWATAPGAKTTRSFGDTGHEMDISELAAALETQRFRFDYLVFDDCFMANIETLYDLRHAVDYIVASPCEIMGAGFPYDRVIPHLFDGSGVLTGLENSCREFWNFYENDWNTIPDNEQSGCISLAVTAQLDALAAQMRRVNETGKRAFDINTLQYYKGGTTKLFYDLGHYVELSCGDPGLAEDFTAQLDKAFPASCRLHTASFYSAYNQGHHPVHDYSGVSVSEPSERYAAENRQTAWYRETHPE